MRPKCRRRHRRGRLGVCVPVVGVLALLAPAACEEPLVAEPHWCGETRCPTLVGYEVMCNEADHCEYRRINWSAEWHADDFWIHVPPGSFQMGTPESEVSETTERPLRVVTFAAGYLFQKYPVTVRAYEACVSAGACTEAREDPHIPSGGLVVNRSADGRGDHPQNGLTWYQAQDVCAWLGGRLPSESEWEFAAKGPDGHRKYPWGDEPEPACHNGTAVFSGVVPPAGFGCGSSGTWPVRATPASASATGARDMAGNLLELVQDCWHPSYFGAPEDGSAREQYCTGDLLPVIPVVARGGSFVNRDYEIRTGSRHRAISAFHSLIAGTRCARSLP